VSIKIADKGREILCGGTMVQPNNVVTAASCLLQKGKVSNRTNIQVFAVDVAYMHV
jgi:secreted trypsin-like serine protease